ncbi:MAG: hypothetical protein LAN84_03985 [Acidobacteriia bacterium]|nr:hypothetical protein [Terriglobia bacterium]
MLSLLLIFAVVFLLNVIPAFAPPTWMAMSYIGIKYPAINPFAVALAGATAATLGRLTLALFSRLLIRQKLLSVATRENVDSIRLALEGRKHVTLGLFLFYAFSPLPTNNLFIAYGLTRFGWRFIAVPFFCGRLVSYTFWNATAASAVRKLNMDALVTGSYFGVYFIVTQTFLLFLVYAFIRIDWRVLATEKKFRWRPRQNGRPGQPGT